MTKSMICNDDSYYYVIIEHRVVYKTCAIMELYNYVKKMEEKGKKCIIA